MRRYNNRRPFVAAAASTAGRALNAARNAISVAATADKAIRLYKNYKPKTAYKTKPKKQRTNMKPAVDKLARQVKVLKQKAISDEGRFTYRHRSSGRVLAGVKACLHSNLTAINTTTLESVISLLKYYNPADPANLTTADATTGTYSKLFMFAKNYAHLTVRNNYQTSCICTVYTCEAKSDTNIDAYTAMTNGLADIGNPTVTSPLVYPTDSPQFNDMWRIVKTTKRMLQAGSEMSVAHSVKPFKYDPSIIDSQSEQYQPEFKSFVFLMRVEGVLAHDSAANEQGTIASGIDWLMDRTFVVEYSAGANLKQLYIVDASTGFTNGALISSKPVADNIVYSVS